MRLESVKDFPTELDRKISSDVYNCIQIMFANELKKKKLEHDINVHNCRIMRKDETTYFIKFYDMSKGGFKLTLDHPLTSGKGVILK